MSDDCERRLSSAIFAHMNMIATGILDALGDESMLNAIFRPGLKHQFDLFTKVHGGKGSNNLEEAVELINKYGHDCKLHKVEPKEDAPELMEIVAVYEDEHLVEDDRKRAVTNFGARTALSECAFLLLSWGILNDDYDVIMRLYEGDDKLLHARLYVVKK